MYMIEPTELEPTYDEIKQMQTQVNQPPNSVDKKRANKTETCPLCNKQLNKKTLKYSHNCQRTKEEPKEQAQPQITDDHIKQYIMQQQQEQQEQQNTIRQNKFSNMIRNMV